jgi:hypothetical protein
MVFDWYTTDKTKSPRLPFQRGNRRHGKKKHTNLTESWHLVSSCELTTSFTGLKNLAIFKGKIGHLLKRYMRGQHGQVDWGGACAPREVYRRANPTIASTKKSGNPHATSYAVGHIRENPEKRRRAPQAAYHWQTLFLEIEN